MDFVEEALKAEHALKELVDDYQQRGPYFSQNAARALSQNLEADHAELIKIINMQLRVNHELNERIEKLEAVVFLEKNVAHA
ncbi:MAG: hypothetical protein WC654_03700 [Patescibacteria group bacterium]